MVSMNGGLICFGGVCIPVNAIWPVVLLGLKWLWETFATPVRCVARARAHFRRLCDTRRPS